MILKGMTVPATSSAAVEQVAIGPKKVTVGTESVEQHSIGDLIEAAKYAASQNAKAKKHFGLRFTRLVPPGGGS